MKYLKKVLVAFVLLQCCNVSLNVFGVLTGTGTEASSSSYPNNLIYGHDKDNKITINGLPAKDLLFRIADKHYGCLRLSATYLKELREEKYGALYERTEADEAQKVKLIEEFERVFKGCAPFYGKLIEDTMGKMAVPVAKSLQIWMSAMEKYLQATGVEGLAEIFVDRKLRHDEKLMQLIRSTMKQPDSVTSAHFGNMLLETAFDKRDLVEKYLMRAYHAGDGFCSHLRSAPFVHITHQITQTLYTYGHLKQEKGPTRSRLDINQYLKDLSLMEKRPDGSFEPVIVLFAAEITCMSFRYDPSEQLAKFVGQPRSYEKPEFAQSLTVNERKWSDKGFIEMEISNLLTNENKRFSCEWIEFFRLRQVSTYLYELGFNFYRFLGGPLQLVSRKLLERCTNRLLVRIREVDLLSLWPEYPNNLLVENLVRRLDRLPERITRNARMMELIDTRTFGWLGEYDDVWLTYLGDHLEKQHNSSEILVKAYATGDEFCKFYQNLFDKQAKYKITHLLALIEMFYPILDMRGLKMDLSTDASAFFVMWRLCSLNSLLPINLTTGQDGIGIIDESGQSDQSKSVKPRYHGTWRFKPLGGPPIN